MLPECFYCPPRGDSSKPPDEYIKKAYKKVVWIWGAEDHMGSVYDWAMDDPNWDRLDYEQRHSESSTFQVLNTSPASAWKRLQWRWLDAGQKMIE